VGSYDNNELNDYLNCLKSVSQDIPFSMRLGNGRHSITLHHNSDGWLLVDPNKLPGICFSDKDLPALATELKKSMQVATEKYATFTTAIYVNQKNVPSYRSRADLLKNNLVWMSIHKITPEKAGMSYFLKLACRRDENASVVQELLHYRDAMPQDYSLPLEEAIKYGYKNLVEVLLYEQKTGLDNLNDVDKAYMRTPLHVAVEAGNLDIIPMILHDKRTFFSEKSPYNFNHDVFKTPEGIGVKKEIEAKLSSEAIQFSVNVVLELVKHEPSSESNLALENNKEVMAAAAALDCGALAYASAELKNDPLFMLPIIENDYISLVYAGSLVKDNADVVLAAIRQAPHFIEHASVRLQNDEQFLLQAIEKNAEILNHIPDAFKNEEFFLKAMEKNDNAFVFIPDCLVHPFSHRRIIRAATVKEYSLHSMSRSGPVNTP